jgi:hypothetical protein
MGGLYDLLETYRIQNDPRFAYEGLYQDPMKPTNVLDLGYNSFTYNPDSPSYGYSTMYADNLQPSMSSSFPQEFGVGSLFNPRVGKPRQSIYFNEPSLNVPQDFYQPIGDPFQTDYPITRTIQEEDEEDQIIEEIIAPYTGVTGLGYQTPRTIADQNRVLGQTFTPQPKSFRDSANLQEYFENRNPITGIINLLGKLPTPMNILRGGLQGIKSLNQKIRGTTFALSPTLKDYVQAKRAEKRAEAGSDVGVGPGGSGSRRGDADIASRDRGSFRTDDTAGFF